MRFRLRHGRDRVPVTAPSAPAPLAGHDPAARGARGERGGEEGSPLSRDERAAARFNASEAARTVAGLIRTLGDPSVSVGASAGAAEEVRVTVAWELTWYQWGVDLGDEAAAGLRARQRSRGRRNRRRRAPVERVGPDRRAAGSSSVIGSSR